MPAGRPEIYTPELADKVCAQLALGESVRTVCAADGMPSMTTVFKWLREKEEFAKQYARAKEESADAMAEDILDIADDGTNDWMERTDSEGNNTGWQINGEHIQRSRLRVESRKWLMSKMKPKKYGDKVTHANDPENPITVLLGQISGTTTGLPGPADE